MHKVVFTLNTETLLADSYWMKESIHTEEIIAKVEVNERGSLFNMTWLGGGDLPKANSGITPVVLYAAEINIIMEIPINE